MSSMNGTLLVDVPSWDDLLRNPAKAAQLSPDVAQTLLIGLVSIQPLLMQRALARPDPQAIAPSERFLTVEEAAAQFGVSAQWLYRHKKQMPHSQPSRKVLVFPEDKLRRWFTARKTG